MKSQQCNILAFTQLNLAGIFIYQLPEDQIEPFNTWLIGQTITTIEGQPFAYASDYNRWYKAWIKDQEAVVID